MWEDYAGTQEEANPEELFSKKFDEDGNPIPSYEAAGGEQDIYNPETATFSQGDYSGGPPRGPSNQSASGFGGARFPDPRGPLNQDVATSGRFPGPRNADNSMGGRFPGPRGGPQMNQDGGFMGGRFPGPGEPNNFGRIPGPQGQGDQDSRMGGRFPGPQNQRMRFPGHQGQGQLDGPGVSANKFSGQHNTDDQSYDEYSEQDLGLSAEQDSSFHGGMMSGSGGGAFDQQRFPQAGGQSSRFPGSQRGPAPNQENSGFAQFDSRFQMSQGGGPRFPGDQGPRNFGSRFPGQGQGYQEQGESSGNRFGESRGPGGLDQRFGGPRVPGDVQLSGLGSDTLKFPGPGGPSPSLQDSSAGMSPNIQQGGPRPFGPRGVMISDTRGPSVATRVPGQSRFDQSGVNADISTVRPQVPPGNKVGTGGGGRFPNSTSFTGGPQGPKPMTPSGTGRDMDLSAGYTGLGDDVDESFNNDEGFEHYGQNVSMGRGLGGDSSQGRGQRFPDWQSGSFPGSEDSLGGMRGGRGGMGGPRFPGPGFSGGPDGSQRFRAPFDARGQPIRPGWGRGGPNTMGGDRNRYPNASQGAFGEDDSYDPADEGGYDEAVEAEGGEDAWGNEPSDQTYGSGEWGLGGRNPSIRGSSQFNPHGPDGGTRFEGPRFGAGGRGSMMGSGARIPSGQVRGIGPVPLMGLKIPLMANPSDDKVGSKFETGDVEDEDGGPSFEETSSFRSGPGSASEFSGNVRPPPGPRFGSGPNAPGFPRPRFQGGADIYQRLPGTNMPGRGFDQPGGNGRGGGPREFFPGASGPRGGFGGRGSFGGRGGQGMGGFPGEKRSFDEDGNELYDAYQGWGDEGNVEEEGVEDQYNM